MKLCTCNNCGQIFQDPNPGNESENYPDSTHFDSLIKLYADVNKPETGYWGCPTCCTDSFLIDNINWPALDDIKKIVVRKKLGQDCTEDESAKIKMWLKETIPLIGSSDIDIIEDIQNLFPLEYGEALDESLADEKGFKN